MKRKLGALLLAAAMLVTSVGLTRPDYGRILSFADETELIGQTETEAEETDVSEEEADTVSNKDKDEETTEPETTTVAADEEEKTETDDPSKNAVETEPTSAADNDQGNKTEAEVNKNTGTDQETKIEDTEETTETADPDHKTDTRIEIQTEDAGAITDPTVTEADVTIETEAAPEELPEETLAEELPEATPSEAEKTSETELSATVDGVTVTVTAEEGVIPVGTTLKVEKITSSRAHQQAADAINELNQTADAEEEKRPEIKAADIVSFDVTLLDSDGNEIEPNGNVSVSFAGLDLSADGDTKIQADVYHFTEDGYETAPDRLSTEISDRTVSCVSDHFSEYNIVVYSTDEISDEKAWYLSNTDAKSFTITTAGQLAYFAQLVNGTAIESDGKATLSAVNFSGRTVQLGADIDLSSISNWTPIGNGSRDSTASGTDANYFSGTFDGQNHSISNLNSTVATDNHGAGLFGAVKNATIKNVNIASGSVSNSQDSAAGVVAILLGDSCTVENCSNAASIEGVGAGGVLARAYASSNTVKNCSNSGTITVQTQKGGGILCINKGTLTLTGCTNTGTVVGDNGTNAGVAGIIGYVDAAATIENCTNKATVGNANDTYAAGIVAYVSKNDATTIKSCTNEGAIKGKTYAGGIVGRIVEGSTLDGCTNSGTVYGETAGGILAGLDNQTSATIDTEIKGCKNTAVVSGTYAGGVVGRLTNKGVVRSCSGGTATVTGSYAGRLVGSVSNGPLGADYDNMSYLSIDDGNGDSYTDNLGTVGIMGPMNAHACLTVETGTFHGAPSTNAYSHLIFTSDSSWADKENSTGTAWYRSNSSSEWTQYAAKMTTSENKTTYYASVANAIKAAAEGSTVTILKSTDGAISVGGIANNVTITAIDGVTVSGGLTGDLANGQTLMIKGIDFTGKRMNIRGTSANVSVTVEDCTFTDVAVDSNKMGAVSIYAHPDNTQASGYYSNMSVTVKDCTFTNVQNGSGVTEAVAIYTAGVKTNVITGNVIDNVTGTGINVNAALGDVTVTENKIKDWASAGGDGRAMRISESSSSTNTTVTNNTMTVVDSKPKESYVKLTGADASDGVDVSKNYWSGKNPVTTKSSDGSTLFQFEEFGTDVLATVASTYYVDAEKTKECQTATDTPIKTAPSYTVPTAVTGLTEDGTAKALVNAGSTADGKIYYRLGESGEWTTTVPTATAAGSYTVYWKLDGDEFHTNVDVTKLAEIVIQAAAQPSGGNTGSSSSSSSSSGSSTSGTWKQDSVGWWYQYRNGSYPRSSWQQLGWLGETHWYHFNAEGYLDAGWFTDTDGRSYFLHDVHDNHFGYMYKGWNEIGGTYYYFSPNNTTEGVKEGQMLRGTVTPDGYRVGEDGAWQQ